MVAWSDCPGHRSRKWRRQAKHHVVRARAAHDSLVVVVAHGELICQALEYRSVALLNVVKRHGIAAAIVVDRAAAGRIRLVGVVGDHKRIKIAQASGRIFPGGVLDIAIRLLPHLKKPVRCVSGISVVGKGAPVSWNGPFGSVLKLVTRVSGSGRTNVCVNPVAAPVVSRFRSPASRDGSTAAKMACGVPGGRIVLTGAKFRVGDGRTVYGAFSCYSRLTKNFV